MYYLHIQSFNQSLYRITNKVSEQLINFIHASTNNIHFQTDKNLKGADRLVWYNLLTNSIIVSLTHTAHKVLLGL